MKTTEKEKALNLSDYFLFSLHLIFFTSIVFSFRAVSSISIGLMLAIGLTQGRSLFNQFSGNRNPVFFLLGCSLLFILQCFALTYTHDVSEGIKLLQRSSGIIIIPFAVFSTSHLLDKKHYSRLAFCFAAILCAGSLYCLTITIFNYFAGAPASTFFYHDLVKPLSQHAIQFSILIFIALVLLMEGLKEKGSHLIQFLYRPMIAFLSLFLLLLSSKLIICVYLLYLLSFFLRKKIYKTKSRILSSIFVTIVITTMVTPNPVGDRFRGMFTGNAMLFVQEKFSPGIYFNGVQFRLLEWRFTYELLNEQHAWLSGLTPGDAQSLLNKKYREMNMYTGIPGTPNHGYLDYHTHNQLLQSLLENGLPALAVFLFICFALFKMAGDSKRTGLKWLVALLLIYCFTDAPFETQYGIVIFTFFPVLLYMTAATNMAESFSTGVALPKFIKTNALKQPN